MNTTSENQFTDLVDLASERLGGAVLFASDEFFAEKDSLIKPSRPIFREDAYTDRGKWMDGWESQRRFGRKEGHDFALIRLGAPGVVRGVVVDTAFFRGNYPDAFSLEGTSLPGYPSVAELLDPNTAWTEFLRPTKLQGNTKNFVAIEFPWRLTHLRFHIYPDGGVARLRVHGEAVPDWPRHGGFEGEVDLASAECGGGVVSCSDMFFGSRHNLIFPGRGGGMHDGWETRRRRGPGHDFAVLKLGARGVICRVVVDTSHFKGNAPDRFSIEGGSDQKGPWEEILPETKLEPHTRHVFYEGLRSTKAFSYARLHIYPDGGVSRLSLLGRISDAGRTEQGLLRLNTSLPALAEQDLLGCCGSVSWARALARARPFSEMAGLWAASERAFLALKRSDWLQAFSAHPKIGQRSDQAGATARSKEWSRAEQSGFASAEDNIKTELEALNRAYEARFGHIFIVCATGKTASEMRALLGARLDNDAETELRNAAEEQKKITELRIRKLIQSG